MGVFLFERGYISIFLVYQDLEKSLQILKISGKYILYFILSSTEIIKFTRKAKARGLNGLVSIIIIEDC